MFRFLGFSYNSLTKISIFLLYLLILAGGVVRCTGSGMGCPDWPKCFGRYIPPTEVNQLPDGYKDTFVEGRIKKNKKLSEVLSVIGMKDLSDKILNDPDINNTEDFNPFKTWTEYVNRLIGAIVGLSLFLIFISSINFVPFSFKLFSLSLISLVLVFFQAWVGSIVVSTNLLPGLITFHVIVALVIICNVILCYYLSSSIEINHLKSKLLSYMILISLILFFIQIVLGTEVRENVDYFLKSFGFENRSNIINSLNENFIIHRSFSLIILLFQSLITILVFIKSKQNKVYKTLSYSMFFLVILEILVGAGMAYFDIPIVLQPIHLIIAFMLFGLQFYIFLINSNIKKIISI